MRNKAGTTSTTEMQPTPEIRELVRRWAPLASELAAEKHAIADLRKKEKRERELRGEIGTLVDDERATFIVDGITYIYERSERDGGTDWPEVWAKALAAVPPRYREKLIALAEMGKRMSPIHNIAASAAATGG